MYTMMLMAALGGGPDTAGFGARDCVECGAGYSPLGARMRQPFGGFFQRLFARCRLKNAAWLPADYASGAPMGYSCGGCFGGCTGMGCGGCGGMIVESHGCGGCSGCVGSCIGGCGGMIAGGPAAPVPMMHGDHHPAMPFPGVPGLPPGAILSSPVPHQGMPMPPVTTPAPAPSVPATIPPVSHHFFRPAPPSAPAPVPTSVTRAAALAAPEGEPLSAKLTFEVPAGATLFVDGQAVPGDGPVRKFHTPPLPRGKTFYYEFKAELRAGGAVQRQEKVIPICAGDLISEKLTELAAK